MKGVYLYKVTSWEKRKIIPICTLKKIKLGSILWYIKKKTCMKGIGWKCIFFRIYTVYSKIALCLICTYIYEHTKLIKLRLNHGWMIGIFHKLTHSYSPHDFPLTTGFLFYSFYLFIYLFILFIFFVFFATPVQYSPHIWCD